MNQLVKIASGELLTTSKTVSDVFGKAHKNVLQAIDDLDCSEEFKDENFKTSYYLSQQNKKLSCVEMTRDGFSFLCMGFKGKKAAKWKEAYIKAFNQMEKGLLNFDQRATQLSLEGKELKEAGKEWSKLGHDIHKRKKKHLLCVDGLISDVQLRLDV